MPVPSAHEPLRRPTDHAVLRAVAAGVVATVGLAVAGSAFWQIDLRYSTPTPVPAGHVEVRAGDRVELPAELERAVRSAPGPTLLHVFNPDCPCSRFNLEHVVEIAREFDGRARVVAVLQGRDARAARSRFDALETGLIACVDPDGEIAAAVGVYSTPQAAIVGPDARLVWRGNYNVSRFCRDDRTEFARIALTNAVADRAIPDLDPHATVAYGCELPRASEDVR